jgi:hypothetical protein
LGKAQPNGYVFDDDYSVMPLPKLAEYIRDNKHLPGIPAAAEAEKNGIELGDMNKKLLEKTEELYLYILQQQKEIDELKMMVKNR